MADTIQYAFRRLTEMQCTFNRLLRRSVMGSAYHWIYIRKPYREMSDGVKVPLEIARAGQSLHHWSVPNVLINHSWRQHGMEWCQRGQKEIARVEGPPRPPHQGHWAVIKVRMEDIVKICTGVAPEMRLPVGLLGALQDSHMNTQYSLVYR